MTIIDAVWTPSGNLLALLCACGMSHWHATNRWRAVCPACGARTSLHAIREKFAESGGFRRMSRGT